MKQFLAYFDPPLNYEGQSIFYNSVVAKCKPIEYGLSARKLKEIKGHFILSFIKSVNVRRLFLEQGFYVQEINTTYSSED